MTSVQLHKIDQSFGDTSVLRGLDLQVESGQYAVLLGESGGGKTTALRVIAGLQAPIGGNVLLGGKDVTATPPRARDVAMVFQHDVLYPHLTVADSIRFALSGRMGRVEIANRVSEAAKLTGVTPLLDRYPHHLSGGELRRAAIAKAIARRSGVRLLDEPLASLDGQARESLQEDIVDWHRRLGGTTIHVTHDAGEAMRMGDVIAVLNQGRIDQCAPPEQIYRRPETLAVARAIGSPTIQCFEAVARSDQWEISDHASALLRLSLPPAAGPSILAARPEAITVKPLGQCGPDGAALRLEGIMKDCKLVQRELLLTVQCGDRTVLSIRPAEAGSPAQPGDPVELCVQVNDLHLFDLNGRRVKTEV